MPKASINVTEIIWGNSALVTAWQKERMLAGVSADEIDTEYRFRKDDKLYVVTKAVNITVPSMGEFLTPAQVDEIINNDVTVNITPPES